MNPSSDPPMLTPDDPRVTAYALGEMNPEETLAFEQAAQANPGLMASVEAIRRTAASLQDILKDEPVETTAPVVYRSSRAFWGFPQAYYYIGFAAAACLAVYVQTRPARPLASQPVLGGGSEVRFTGMGSVVSAPAQETSAPMPRQALEMLPVPAGTQPAPMLASLEAVEQTLAAGALPGRGSVNVRSVVDSVAYAYPSPSAEAPFSVSVEAAQEPWAEGRVLVRIGLRSRDDRVVSQVRVHLAFDSVRFESGSTWGYRPQGVSGGRASVDSWVGTIPAGMERTIVVELVRRPGMGGPIGVLSANATYLAGKVTKVLENAAQFGSDRFVDADADYQYFACIFRYAEILSYRPAGSASAMREVSDLASHLGGSEGRGELASSATAAAGLLNESALVEGSLRWPSRIGGG